MKKMLIVCLVIFIAGSKLSAQEYSTSISIREQIMDNKTPNAVYAAGSEQKQTVLKGFVGSSFAKLIREGKVGMPVATTAPTIPNTVPVVNPNKSMTSDVSAEEHKAALDKNKIAVKPVMIPAQDETEAAKTVPVEKKKEQ